jgi:hypothetical protein
MLFRATECAPLRCQRMAQAKPEETEVERAVRVMRINRQIAEFLREQAERARPTQKGP